MTARRATSRRSSEPPAVDEDCDGLVALCVGLTAGQGEFVVRIHRGRVEMVCSCELRKIECYHPWSPKPGVIARAGHTWLYFELFDLVRARMDEVRVLEVRKLVAAARPSRTTKRPKPKRTK